MVYCVLLDIPVVIDKIEIVLKKYKHFCAYDFSYIPSGWPGKYWLEMLRDQLVAKRTCTMYDYPKVEHGLNRALMFVIEDLPLTPQNIEMPYWINVQQSYGTKMFFHLQLIDSIQRLVIRLDYTSSPRRTINMVGGQRIKGDGNKRNDRKYRPWEM